MSREGFHSLESDNPLPIDHGKIQARIAEFSFRAEHPEVPTPDHRTIMNAWVNDHAADWRKVIDAHAGETLRPKDLNDPLILRAFYDEMLRRHDGDQTRH